MAEATTPITIEELQKALEVIKRQLLTGNGIIEGTDQIRVKIPDLRALFALAFKPLPPSEISAPAETYSEISAPVSTEVGPLPPTDDVRAMARGIAAEAVLGACANRYSQTTADLIRDGKLDCHPAVVAALSAQSPPPADGGDHGK